MNDLSKKLISKICQENKIIYLGLFGSYARNEAKDDSDVDLIVDFKEVPSLFGLARIKKSFEDVLEKDVDLVMKSNVKNRLKPYIYKDLQVLYEKG